MRFPVGNIVYVVEIFLIFFLFPIFHFFSSKSSWKGVGALNNVFFNLLSSAWHGWMDHHLFLYILLQQRVMEVFNVWWCFIELDCFKQRLLFLLSYNRTLYIPSLPWTIKILSFFENHIRITIIFGRLSSLAHIDRQACVLKESSKCE